DREDPAVRAAGAAGRPGLTAQHEARPPEVGNLPTLTVGPTTRDHPHGHRLDYRLEPGPPGDERPPLVFLHEGLGSVELWRTFPDQVRAAVGGPTTLVYSRAGYGR